MLGGNFADSNRASLRYILENSAAWGVTPASGSPREMRITGSQLAAQKETQTSNELRSDRMVSNIIEVGASAEGDVSFEFSAGAIDDFLAAFLYGMWSRPMTMDVFRGKHVAITGVGEITIGGGNREHYFTVGRRMKLEGFQNAINNTYVTVAAVAGGTSTVLTVTGAVLTPEIGSDTTAVLDANDVLVLKNTDLRFGTDGAAAIDSDGTNAFAALVAANQIVVGQKIHVDGLGMESGSIAFGAAAAEGDTITITDGVKRKSFQFGGVILPGYIDVDAGADAEASAANLAAAIMAETAKNNLAIKAIADVGTITLTNLEAVTGGAIVEDIDSADEITVTTFAGGDDTIRGVFTVTTVADDVIGVFPAPATNANAGGAAITVKGSMIRNPSRVEDFIRQSFTVETSFEDIDRHFVATGLRVGTFELEIASGEISTGSIQMMGRAMERRIDNTSLLRRAPYTPKDAPQHEIMNATSNVGNLAINGEEGMAYIQSISINGDASLREQRAVGHKYAVGIGVGRFQLTGSFSAFFETGELFDKFVNHETVSLAFHYKDNARNRYEFTVPAIKLTSDPIAPEGIDQDVIENIEWEAQMDAATRCMLQIDRFSSTLPAMA